MNAAARDTCVPWGGAAGFGKIWAAEVCDASPGRQGSMRVGGQRRRGTERGKDGRYKSQSPSADDDRAYRKQGEGY